MTHKDLIKDWQLRVKRNTNAHAKSAAQKNYMRDVPSTFVRGAWFSDTIIKDNVLGGHTWKFKFDSEGRINKYRPGDYNSFIQFVTNDMYLDEMGIVIINNK